MLYNLLNWYFFHSYSSPRQSLTYIYCIFLQCFWLGGGGHQEGYPSTQEDAGVDPLIYWRWGLWDSPTYQIPAPAMPPTRSFHKVSGEKVSHETASIWRSNLSTVTSYQLKTSSCCCFSCCLQILISEWVFFQHLSIYSFHVIILLTYCDHSFGHVRWKMTVFNLLSCHVAMSPKNTTKCTKIDIHFLFFYYFTAKAETWQTLISLLLVPEM